MKLKNIVKMVLGMAAAMLCFGVGKEAVSADVIIPPPENEFVEENGASEVYENGRMFEIIDAKISFHKYPNSEEIVSLDNDYEVSDCVRVYYIFIDEKGNSWAYICDDAWVEMKCLKLVYDNIEFVKDNEDKIKDYTNELEGHMLKLPLKIYEYPGSEDYNEVRCDQVESSVPLSDWLTPKSVYIDEQGKTWGYIYSYNWGRRKGWYCIDDLPEGKVLEIFKGDVNFDRKIDLTDVKSILKDALGIAPLDEKAKVNADVNDDGKVDLTDTKLGLGEALGICSIESANSPKKVNLSAEKISEDSNIIQYTIFNNTDEMVSYGYELSIEKFVEGNWEKVEFEYEIVVCDLAILAYKGDKNKMVVNLDDYFDGLTSGKYRICKSIDGSKYYAEFFL